MDAGRFYLSKLDSAAGVDEAGRGCLAGPVVAAAVILPFPCPVSGLDDSKKLSSGKRSLLADQVKRQARAWSIGLSWPSEIDQINILQATLKAMARAVKGLKIIPDQILVDGNQKIPLEIPQKTIPGGDSLVPSISAASILAKTFRDGLMVSLEKKYPGYGFAGHKGYGTREHLRAIKSLGPSPVHRMTFKGVRVVTREKMLWLTKG
ncbi:ribonuclease HII [Desulfonatronovibrio hydrogenovorans]|uniref:ribonuclease HII n=1 Tax=Desulfonatronovibrio hydrogenovorans TaxID=53245 RepID=UPI00048E125B|nr:ribonuclease HII [Desulfonatronovibrio hydrogenovorans]